MSNEMGATGIKDTQVKSRKTKKPIVKKAVKRLRVRKLGQEDGFGLCDIAYPTMTTSNTDCHRIENAESIEINNIKTIFIFQAVDADTEIRVANVGMMCDRYHIRANISYQLKRKPCGRYGSIISTFTIESAINNIGHGVHLSVGLITLLKVVALLSECEIDEGFFNDDYAQIQSPTITEPNGNPTVGGHA